MIGGFTSFVNLGQIVYQARHRNAKGPLQMVLSENWLVYLYYNLKARRTEISVVEMFEGFEEKNRYALMLVLYSE